MSVLFELLVVFAMDTFGVMGIQGHLVGSIWHWIRIKEVDIKGIDER